MKNKIRFEDLTHLIFLFLLFLSFTTIFLSMKNKEEEKEILVCGVDESDRGYEISTQIIEGKSLFRANCASCHASDMSTDLTGPGLGGVTERWARRETNLKEWIRNAPKYLSENSDDEYAKNLSKKYAGGMTAFPNLKDEEIENILAYIEAVHNQ